MSTDLVTTSGASVSEYFGAGSFDPDVDPDDVQGLSPDMVRIKMPSGGGTAFEIPGDDPERPDSVRDLDCIVVHSHESSTLWLTKQGEGEAGAAPHAESHDGVNQIVTQEAIDFCDAKGWPHPSPILAHCPYNQPGSKKKYLDPSASDYAKVNKNQRTLYILRPGQPAPDELTLSPTSLRPWSNYAVATKQVPWKYLTRITLKKIEKRYVYSIAQFQNLGMLPEEVVAQVRELKQNIKAMVGSVAAAPQPDFEPTEVVAPNFAAAFDADEPV